jgi:hypothetical protein
MPGTSFVTNAELDVWINEGIGEVHDKLARAFGEDFLETSVAFTCDGTEYIDLPADFLRLLGIDLTLNGTTFTLEPFNRANRAALSNQRVVVWPNLPRYKLSGPDRIRLLPAPANGVAGVLWYQTAAVTLVADTDYVNFPNGWESYAAVYAAIQMLMKEESNTDQLQGLLDKWDAELEMLVEERDAGSPHQVVDSDASDPQGWYR